MDQHELVDELEKIKRTEAACHILVRAALLRKDLTDLEDQSTLDSDFQTSVSCAVSTCHQLEIMVMNAITALD